MGYIIDVAVIGSVGTNCYLFMDEDTHKGFIVDPADNAERIVDMVNRNNCELQAILITHGHFDHITAAEAVKKKFNVKIYASEKEVNILNNPELNLSLGMGRHTVSMKADVLLKDKESINSGGVDIIAIHTPGHTEGGVCYYVKDASILFSGDTLFAESVGRTDFPTGSMKQIVDSVKTKLFVLPDDTRVFPGHGEGTSIAYEKKYNPFCQ